MAVGLLLGIALLLGGGLLFVWLLSGSRDGEENEERP